MHAVHIRHARSTRYFMGRSYSPRDASVLRSQRRPGAHRGLRRREVYLVLAPGIRRRAFRRQRLLDARADQRIPFLGGAEPLPLDAAVDSPRVGQVFIVAGGWNPDVASLAIATDGVAHRVTTPGFGARGRVAAEEAHVVD